MLSELRLMKYPEVFLRVQYSLWAC